MGLLGTSWDDPKTAATLQLVSGLLGNSNFGRGASQGLLGYSQALQQQKQQKQLEDLRAMQMQQMQQQLQMQQEAAAQRQKDQGLLRQQFSPLAGPTPDGGPLMPRFDPASMIGQGGSIDAVTQAAQVQSMLNPQRKLMNVAPGASVIDETGKTVFQAPDKPEKDPEQIRVLKMIYGEGTPAYLQALQRLGEKATTHQPGVNLSFGTPMPAVNPKTGEVELMRPDNKGGMTFTGVKPAPQDRDVKLPAELQRMQIAGDAMVELLDRYEAMLKKNNPRDPLVQMNPTIRAEMQSIKRNMELQFKELQALGALAGPDIDIMRQALADPFSVSGAFFGKEGLLAQTKQARDLVKMRKDAVIKSQGRPTAPAQATDNDPLGLR